MKPRFVCLAIVALAPLLTGFADETANRGYLVTFCLKARECRFSSASLIENYFQKPQPANIDDWTVCLEDEAGNTIWQAAFGNPGRFFPVVDSDQPLPFTVKVPLLSGAQALALRDQRGTVRLRKAVDAELMIHASESRTRFLRADKENRDAVSRLAGRTDRGGLLHPAESATIEPGDWLLEQEMPEWLEQLDHDRTASVSVEPRHIAEGPASVPQQVTNLRVQGTVTSDTGSPVPFASVVLRNLGSTTALGKYWLKSTNASGLYSCQVPSNLCPAWFALCVSSSQYVRKSILIWVAGDVTQDVVLNAGNKVSGTVSDASGKPLFQARVRAYKGAAFADSALTKADGSYSLELRTGIYDFTVLSPDTAPHVPASVTGLDIQGSKILNFTVPPTSGLLVVRLFYPDEGSYLLTESAPKRFEIEQAGRLLIATRSGKGTPAFDSVKGKYFVPYSFFLDAGEYNLSCYPLGHAPVRVSNIQVAGETTVDCELGPAITWSGLLRGADGVPLLNVPVRSYDDLAAVFLSVRTNSEGRFTVPITPDGLLKFSADAGSSNILRIEHLGPDPEARVDDCVLEQFPPVLDSGAVLTQMYGTSDRLNRENIVILGDGYTDVGETFTDQNANGQWDGYLFYDLNSDGLWNTGEPYRGFGDRRNPPLPGTNPTAGNEPFQDLNQDGVPNLDDQALFDQNSVDTVRSTFGQDFWREHRDAFNIFRIRVISKQAGHDILDKSGNAVVTRDTALGTFLSDPDRNYILRADRASVMQYVNAYLPEADVVIVLMNQAIPMGRATSFILLQGGYATDQQNREAVAHELGHNPGYLADEYSEFESNYTGDDLIGPNITAQFDPDLIPWRSLLTRGKEIPSVPGSCGVGLFEGAGYYTGGCYRPTQNCMMVGGPRFCPVCKQELQIRVARLTRKLPVPVPLIPSGVVTTLRPMFRWAPQPGVSHWYLDIQPVDESSPVETHDVYGTWFLRSTALQPGRLYRWRLRPFAEDMIGAPSEWVYFHASPRKPRREGR